MVVGSAVSARRPIIVVRGLCGSAEGRGDGVKGWEGGEGVGIWLGGRGKREEGRGKRGEGGEGGR